MRFRTRLLLCAAIPALMFVLALAVSLWGAARTQQDFGNYIEGDQAVAAGLSELYAQGLQTGQALRNIVLDPANPKAFDNLKAARDAFAVAYTATMQSAKGGPFEQAVAELAPLRAAQATLQDEVSVLARTDAAAAVVLLNAKETPAWRALRGALLTNIAAARKAAATAHAATEQRASRVNAIAAALALLAVLVAASLCIVMLRTLRREMGADPAQVREALREVAAGNLVAGSSTSGGSSGQPSGLMAELESMQSGLRALVVQVRDATVSITHASDEIAQGNSDLSARTEQQASALEETSASMEQLNSTVRQNADNAGPANTLAVEARKVATEGGEVVAEVVSTMKGINDSSRKISDIIGVIDGIAFQTNILALNAAVEAARAGEQGRGFAVVASEVRSLAGRSAEAAREIKGLIGASVERVEAGSALVDRAVATMSQVVEAIGRVTDIVGEISAASREQSLGVAQVGEAVTQMDQATQQNAALVEESAAAATSMRAQAHELLQAVAKFQVGDAASAGPLRAASPMPTTRPPLAALQRSAAPRPAAPQVTAPRRAATVATAPRINAKSSANPKSDTDDWESF